MRFNEDRCCTYMSKWRVLSSCASYFGHIVSLSAIYENSVGLMVCFENSPFTSFTKVKTRLIQIVMAGSCCEK